MKKRFYVTQYAAIFHGKGMLLLKDNDRLKGTWVFPGGHIAQDTNPFMALAREIREETCLVVKKAAVLNIVIKKYQSGWRLVIYYKCKATGKIRLSNEHSEYKWVSLKDAKRMKFRDAAEKKVIMGLLKNR